MLYTQLTIKVHIVCATISVGKRTTQQAKARKTRRPHHVCFQKKSKRTTRAEEERNQIHLFIFGQQNENLRKSSQLKWWDHRPGHEASLQKPQGGKVPALLFPARFYYLFFRLLATVLTAPPTLVRANPTEPQITPRCFHHDKNRPSSTRKGLNTKTYTHSCLLQAGERQSRQAFWPPV